MEIKIIEFLQAGRSGFWDFFFKAMSWLGTYIGLAAMLVVMFFICRKRFLLFGGCLGIGFLGSLLVKYIVKRERPFVNNPEVLCLMEADGYSFPSLHSVCAAILAVFLCYIVFYKSKKVWARVLTIVLATLFMLLVALSRVYLGVHYMTDVCAGLLIGVVVSVVMILIYEKWLDKWLDKFKILRKKDK